MEQAPELDFNIDIPPAEDVEPPKVEYTDDQLGLENFSPEEMVAASQLMKLPSICILHAIVEKVLGMELKSILAEELDIKVFIKICAVLGSLGSTKMASRKLGSYHPHELDTARRASINVLKASLVRPSVAVTKHFTSLSVQHLAAECAGATVSIDGEYSIIRVPGYFGVITVSNVGKDRAREIAGGKDFIDWYNQVFNTRYGYIKISGLVREIAYLVVSYFKVSGGSQNAPIVLQDNPGQDPEFSRKFCCPGMLRSTDYDYLRKLVVNAFQTNTYRPIIASSADTLEFMEAFLEDTFPKLGQLHRQQLESYAKKCALLEIKVATLQDLYPGLFAKDNAVDVPTITSLRSGNFEPVPFFNKGVKLATYGNLAKIVEDSREKVRRGDRDLPKKYDAYSVGCAAGPKSSVPEKIHRCIADLKLISQHEKFPRVHAYGTDVCNYWETEVVMVSESVTFRDINKDNAPKSKVNFEVANVETMEPGSGEGYFVFDDTFVFTGKGNSQHQEFRTTDEKKIKSIIGAGYSGGFVKLYLGNSSDTGNSVAMMPSSLKLLSDAYSRVSLVVGGAAHSPEYFAVFYGKGNSESDNWMPPTLVVSDKTRVYVHGKPNTSLIPHSDVVRKRVSYLQTWIALKMYDVLRFNALLNTLAMTGVQTFPKIESWLSPLTLGTGIRLGGNLVPSTNIPTSSVPIAPPELDL